MIPADLTLSDCICRIIHKRGGIRKAARELGIDAAYLYRLSVQLKNAPSAATLRKLGISKEIRYRLIPPLPKLNSRSKDAPRG